MYFKVLGFGTMVSQIARDHPL